MSGFLGAVQFLTRIPVRTANAVPHERVVPWFAVVGALIGAGLACTGMGGAAVGVGHVVGNYLSGALRNPSAAGGQTATMFIGIAFSEALGIFSFLVALLLMYAQ